MKIALFLSLNLLCIILADDSQLFDVWMKSKSHDRDFIRTTIFKLKPAGRWIELCVAAFPPIDSQTLEYPSCEAVEKLNMCLDRRLTNLTGGSDIARAITIIWTANQTQDQCVLPNTTTTEHPIQPTEHPIEPTEPSGNEPGDSFILAHASMFWAMFAVLICFCVSLPLTFYLATRFARQTIASSRERIINPVDENVQPTRLRFSLPDPPLVGRDNENYETIELRDNRTQHARL